MAAENPTKLCECGCGKPAPIAKVNHASRGAVRGQPLRFVRGHATTIHRHSKPRTRTYKSWLSMMERCFNTNAPNYQSYGGAGISVCERWRSFPTFLADMGERPNGHSLDRYPNQRGNYEPSNCRWATAKEQVRNTSQNVLVEYDGLTLCLAAWAEKLGMQRVTITQRYRNGDRPPHLFRSVRRYKRPPLTSSNAPYTDAGTGSDTAKR